MVRINLESKMVPKLEQELRKALRCRKVPGDIYLNKYGKFTFKFRKCQVDPYGSVLSFASEEDIREKFFYPYIEKGKSLVYDVGASLGSWTLPALAIGAKVVAFEPDPRSNIQENVELNEGFAENFTLVQKAVFNRSPGRLDFDELEDVPAVTIDEFGGKPDYIKIDVEGMESMVIEGAMETIKKYRPKILVENHFEKVNSENWIIEKLVGEVSYDYEAGPKTEQVSYSFFH